MSDRLEHLRHLHALLDEAGHVARQLELDGRIYNGLAFLKTQVPSPEPYPVAPPPYTSRRPAQAAVAESSSNIDYVANMKAYLKQYDALLNGRSPSRRGRS